ncbi:unnamed protein product, partial [Nesidiocoris tenuis]
MPSGIVGKIMGRLLEAEVERQNQEAYHRAQHQQAMFMNGTVQHCQASQTQGGYSPKLARLAHSLMVKMNKSPRISPKPGNFEEAETEKSDRAYPPSTHNGHHVSSSEDSSARTDSRSRVLFEVSEEDENCASSKTDVSESSKSVPSSETVQDDSWLSSLAGIDENGLETSATKLFRDGLPSGREARRGSFPEVRHSADRRRASLLESWVLAEIGSSQNEERCSSCGSRKTSATEVAPPSKSTCDLVEIGTDPYLPPEYEEVDSMAGIVSAAKDSEKPKEEYASNNEFPLRPISEDNCATPAAEGPSLAMELNHLAEPGLAESDPSWSPPADQIVVAKDFCSCDDLAEETSASGSSTISKNSPIREDERKHVQLAMIEKALQLYHKRLKELDLRGHLRDLLAGQLLRVNDLLDSVSSPSALTIVMKQVTDKSEATQNGNGRVAHARRSGKNSAGGEMYSFAELSAPYVIAFSSPEEKRRKGKQWENVNRKFIGRQATFGTRAWSK